MARGASQHAGGEARQADQLELQALATGQRADPGRGAGGHHVARLQAEVAGDVLDQRNDRRSEEHTSELQSRANLVCRLLLEKKNMFERMHGDESAYGDVPLEALRR